MKYMKAAALFSIGGGTYVGLELLYRGYSHISMFAAGGLCFLLLGKVGSREHSLGVKLCLGAGLITAVELAAGLLVNRDHTIWDYRNQPGNFLGQICPVFTALWVPVSLAAMGLYRQTDRLLSRLLSPDAQKDTLP